MTSLTCHGLNVASEDSQSLVTHRGQTQRTDGQQGPQTQEGTASPVQHTGSLPGVGRQVGEVELSAVDAADLQELRLESAVADTVAVHAQ